MNEDNEQVKIKLHKEEVRKRLQDQINKGREIAGLSVKNKADLENAKQKYKLWFDYSKDLLLVLFTGEKLKEEFLLANRVIHATSGFHGEIEEFLRILKAYLTKLESILERVDLYQESFDSDYIKEMKGDIITDIRKILIYRNRSDLSDLLRDSHSSIDVSTSYGSKLFSLLSTLKIYSPFRENEQLKNLNEEDKNFILSSALEIYPPEVNSPELKWIEFYVDLNIEPQDRTITSQGLKDIGFDYISQQLNKSESKIINCDYDGAITNARTLVESVCLYLLEENRIEYEYKGDLPRLYKEVTKILKMDPSHDNPNCVKQILSGFISVINGLSSLRNEMSDSHGKSKRDYYKPEKRHATLAVNTAKVISEFLYISWKNGENISIN